MTAHTKTPFFILLMAAAVVFGGWHLVQLKKEIKARTVPAGMYQYGPASFDGIGKIYLGREISNMIGGHGAIEWLERADREQSEKPATVIAALQLAPDSVVADIGAGSGYFTFRIAPLIPRGKIFAVEIGPEMLAFLKTKTQEHGLSNVIVHTGQPDSTLLPAEAIDVAFMVDAYHEFSHPHEMMQSIYRALKPGGRVVFVEYRGEDPELQIKPRHKMTVAQLTKEMNAVGLVWVRTNNDLPIQHITTFQKP